MNKYPDKPILMETDSEYLLKIHPAQRERAKGIEGRRWDPNRQCWIYPKTQRVYNALFTEFGDELTFIKREVIPTQQSPESPDIGELENVSSKEQNGNKEIGHLKLEAELASKLVQMQALQQQLNEKDEEIIRITRELTVNKQELDKFRLELQSVKSKKSLEDTIKEVALDSTSNDPKFRALVERLTLDSMASIKIANQLTDELREWLVKEGLESSGDLFNLITIAKEHELLPQGAVDLAHTIRRQRNVFAHEGVHEKTILPRVFVSLFSASLLWPELPE